MGDFLYSIMNNDSAFGKIMTRLGIMIGANIMFCIFCLPVVTIGPSVTALYHVMFRVMRSDGIINPFKEFWIGFRRNFKQSIAVWLLFLAVMIVGLLDLRFADYMGGVMELFRIGIYAVGAAVLVITLYLFPVIACFEDSLKGQVRNAVFFIARNPVRMIIIAVIDVIPLYLSYMDVQRLPLWGFLWTIIGCSAVVMLGASLLLKDFSRYLPEIENDSVED